MVYHSSHEKFKDLLNVTSGKVFIVQRYIHNPYLLCNYKFHFRMYTILSGIHPFRAFLYRDGHALFSTKPYTLSKDTLAENFDTFVHLTNWSVNFSKGNKHLSEDKPGIGIGCEWTVKKMLRVIKEANPEFDQKAWWKEVGRICAYTMHSISQWKNVQRIRKFNSAHPRIEVFGCDIIMDDKFKVYLMEANTMVGLQATPERFPDLSCRAKCCGKNGCKYCKGEKNPNAKLVNEVTEKVVNASMDILQLDCEMKNLSKNLMNLHAIFERNL